MKHIQNFLPCIDDNAHEDIRYFERIFMARGMSAIAGVDEAGRGCLAGPVVAAAVILPVNFDVEGVTDSKKIPHPKRKRLDEKIRENALSWAVARVDVETIDSINILQASLRAMSLAVDRLEIPPDIILIDGNRSIPHPLPQKTIVKGDSRSLSIAAASIVAKEYRDRLMVKYSEKWPEYGFHLHKGYGTAKHREAIAASGPCPIHRKGFKGVKEYWKE